MAEQEKDVFSQQQQALDNYVACFLCPNITDRYVVDSVNQKKVSCCPSCFEKIRPSKKNKQLVEWWRHIFPIIKEK